MIDNLYQNWPVYLLAGGFVVFAIYAIINSRQQERKNRKPNTTKENAQAKK